MKTASLRSFRCARRQWSSDAELIAWARGVVENPSSLVTEHQRSLIASLLTQLEVTQ